MKEPMEPNMRRKPRRVLTPEQKWEVYLESVTTDMTQADLARKWRIDASVVRSIPKTVKDAALAAFAAARPGRNGQGRRDVELDDARREIAELTEAIKSQAIDLALMRGKSFWA